MRSADPVATCTSDRTDGAVGHVQIKRQIIVNLARPLAQPAFVYTFTGLTDGEQHLAIRLGELSASSRPLVRVHSECLLGDVFGSRRCDCGPQLDEAVERVEAAGGWLLYLRQEGRGIGLYNKLEAYALQDSGLNTFEANEHLGFPADGRDYRAAAEMLMALNVPSIDLLTNNPEKIGQLQAYGIDIGEVHPTGTFTNDTNTRYLRAKAEHACHTLIFEGAQ
jgi:GTP cyclohydrolase II